MAIIRTSLPPPPLADFPLAWRWHGDGRQALPPQALARLQVLPADEARAAFQRSAALLRGDRLDAGRFAVREYRPRTPGDAQAARWLCARQHAMHATVCLSWEPELALRTCWAVFARHWHAFCQPGSDDLVVFPASLRWAVFYHHAERLQFGQALPAGEFQRSFRPP